MADPQLDAQALARWRRNPASFIEEVLHDPEIGRPYRLLPAERRFVAHAFKTNRSGRLLYPEQVYSAPKKSGKTAFAGMLVLTTILLFGGNYPEANIAANALEQAKNRVFEAIKRIVECSPLLRREAKVISDTITFPAIGATIKAIPSDYAGAAGGNQVISCFDELWAYANESARRLWDELVPPPTRKIACRLCVTYAGFAGESELLEDLYKRGLAQPLVGPDLRAGDGIVMFWSHEPVAPWQDERWLAEMRRSLRPNAYLRMIENRFVTSESTFIDPGWFDSCVDPDARMILSAPRLPVYVGIDASVKHDSTAIVAVTWDRTTNKCRLVWHRIFQPSPDQPLNFESTVERSVLELRERFDLINVRFDPYQMQASAQRLRAAGVRVEEFPQTIPNLTEASSNLYELIKARALVVYPDAGIRRAMLQAVAKETPRGWRISKEKQSHKIDAVVALAMAAYAGVQEGARPPAPQAVFGFYSNSDGIRIFQPPKMSRLQVEAEHWSQPCTLTLDELEGRARSQRRET